MSMLKIVPHLIPVKSNGMCCQYEGFITLVSQSYRISIVIPNDGNFKNAELECDWKLASHLTHKLDQIRQELKDSKDLPSFFNRFIKIAETCLQNNGVVGKQWTENNEHVFEELQQVGWNKILSISENFTDLEIGCYDRGQRHHVLKVKLDIQLSDMVAQFEAVLEMYQDFWNMLDEIDKNTWVLEPETASFSCTYRRIAIGQNLSLHIVVNPLQPSTLPECQFLGAECAIAPLREKLNINLHHWDLERSLLNNLLEVLEIDFPSPSEVCKEELNVECGICYSHRLDEETPDIVCQHTQCSQCFHYSCLYEWLRDTSCRQSFNFIFGECPFCSKPIRVKLQVD